MNGKTPENVDSQKSLILRGIVRELDLFVENLMEVEKNTSQLIESARDDISSNAAVSLQSLDYMAQVSASLSLVLSNLDGRSDIQLDEVLATLTPQDLAQRLLEATTDTIEQEARFEYF